jgi:hypothetical protein
MNVTEKYLASFAKHYTIVFIVAIVLVIYAAFVALMLTSPLVNFGGNYFIRSILFGVILVTALYHPLMSLSLLVAILLTYQYYYTKSYLNDLPQVMITEPMTLDDNIKNNDNYIVADNYPEVYDNNSMQNIWPQAQADNTDGQDPRNNFYPSFVNEIVPDSYDVRRTNNTVDGFDDRDAFDRNRRYQ